MRLYEKNKMLPREGFDYFHSWKIGIDCEEFQRCVFRSAYYEKAMLAVAYTKRMKVRAGIIVPIKSPRETGYTGPQAIME